MIQEEKLLDIYDVWFQPFWNQQWFLIGMFFLLLIIAGFTVYYCYKKYFYKPVKIHYSDKALQLINALLDHSMFLNISDDVVFDQQIKDSYFRLTTILKDYLSDRYDISFTGLTDEETIKIAQKELELDSFKILQQTLKGMVAIKFANQVVAKQKLREDIESVKQLIKDTTLKSQQG